MWNTRRSAALYAEKVEDSSERLQGMLRKNNCLDKTEIERQVRSLPGLSVPNLNALLERTSSWYYNVTAAARCYQTTEKTDRSEDKSKSDNFPLVSLYHVLLRTRSFYCKVSLQS